MRPVAKTPPKGRKTQKYRPSTVSKISDTALITIFLYYNSSDSRKPVELVLSQVCQRWRNLALNLPALWTRIVLNCPLPYQEDFLMMYINRSVGTTRKHPSKRVALPLELYIEATDYTPWSKILDIMQANKYRWRALSIRLPSLLILSVPANQFSRIDLPRLEHLSLISYGNIHEEEMEYLSDRRSMYSSLLFPYSKNIRTLRLQSPSVAYLQFPTELVTTLHLKQYKRKTLECPSLHILLESFPSIMHLSLQGDFVRFGPPEADRKINTPKLRSLRVCDSTTLSTLLLTLSAPNLSSLTLLNTTSQHLTLFQSLYHPWTSSSSDKFPLLRTLTLVRPQLSLEVFKRLFSDFPGITRLDLINCYADPILNILETVNPDLVAAGIRVPLPLPALRTLTIHHFADADQATLRLVEVLATRAEVGTCIPVVKLHKNIPKKGVFLLLRDDIGIRRWEGWGDGVGAWPRPLALFEDNITAWNEEDEKHLGIYRVFEDEHDMGMQVLTKPPKEVTIFGPPMVEPEVKKVGWWEKLIGKTFGGGWGNVNFVGVVAVK